MNTLAYRLVPGNNTWNRLGRELNRASSVQKSTAASILAPILSIHSRLIGQPFITRITRQPVAIDAEGIFPPISPLGNLAAASGRPAGDEVILIIHRPACSKSNPRDSSLCDRLQRRACATEFPPAKPLLLLLS